MSAPPPIGRASFRNILHQSLGFVVAEGEVFRVQTSPPSLLLSKREAPGVPHDLADTSMTEKVRVHGRWFADRTVGGRAQGQHEHISPF